MKKLINLNTIILILALASFSISKAQVGIGTTTPATGAVLDLDDPNRGLLVPRVNIADLTTDVPVTGATTGLLVWNTSVTTGVGFHYWDSNDWIPLLGGTLSDDWTIIGNNATNGGVDEITAGVNFIGTTDDQRLKFRTNNVERMEILPTGEVQVGALNEIDPFAGDTFSARADEYPMNSWGNASGDLDPSPGVAYGTAYYSRQVGDGTLFFGQHLSDVNDGIVVQMQNGDNEGDGIRVLHSGGGSSIVAQTQDDNTLGNGPISVGDFSYSGTDLDDHIAVDGESNPGSAFGFGYGVGVHGEGGWFGVHGEKTGSGIGFGVFSTGDFGGTGAKYFVIDHPLDPENKYLKHANIESNEILNLYRGKIVFDINGKATVTLPHYFNAINNDNINYQLTAIGAAMPNLYIESEIENGIFVIAGGIVGKKVSWQVTAERNDPYLQKYPEKRIMEFEKGSRKGKYLMPELYNKPEEDRIGYTPKKETITLDKKPLQKIKYDADDIKSENINQTEESKKKKQTFKTDKTN